MTVEWCPKCRAMLPPGLEECPSCGTRLRNDEGQPVFSGKDIAWFSAYVIGLLLIPILVIFGVGTLCILLTH